VKRGKVDLNRTNNNVGTTLETKATAGNNKVTITRNKFGIWFSIYQQNELHVWDMGLFTDMNVVQVVTQEICSHTDLMSIFTGLSGETDQECSKWHPPFFVN
jgi:hypothetical protein